jgi:hypothetical protein
MKEDSIGSKLLLTLSAVTIGYIFAVSAHTEEGKLPEKPIGYIAYLKLVLPEIWKREEY